MPLRKDCSISVPRLLPLARSDTHWRLGQEAWCRRALPELFEGHLAMRHPPLWARADVEPDDCFEWPGKLARVCPVEGRLHDMASATGLTNYLLVEVGLGRPPRRRVVAME